MGWVFLPPAHAPVPAKNPVRGSQRPEATLDPGKVAGAGIPAIRTPQRGLDRAQLQQVETFEVLVHLGVISQ